MPPVALGSSPAFTMSLAPPVLFFFGSVRWCGFFFWWYLQHVTSRTNFRDSVPCQISTRGRGPRTSILNPYQKWKRMTACSLQALLISQAFPTALLPPRGVEEEREAKREERQGRAEREERRVEVMQKQRWGQGSSVTVVCLLSCMLARASVDCCMYICREYMQLVPRTQPNCVWPLVLIFAYACALTRLHLHILNKQPVNTGQDFKSRLNIMMMRKW